MAADTSRPEPAAARPWDLARGDLQLGLGALVVTALSVLLTPGDSALALFGWELPPLCLSRILLDRECFGCGMTRSFTFMGHADLEGAWRLHKLGPPLYVLVAAQIPYRALRVYRTVRKAGAPRAPAVS